MNVLLFGSIHELVQQDRLQPDAELHNLAGLKTWLEQQYPQLATQAYAFAVNNRVEHNLDTPLHTTDTVALLPPFSGG